MLPSSFCQQERRGGHLYYTTYSRVRGLGCMMKEISAVQYNYGDGLVQYENTNLEEEKMEERADLPILLRSSQLVTDHGGE